MKLIYLLLRNPMNVTVVIFSLFVIEVFNVFEIAYVVKKTLIHYDGNIQYILELFH